MLGFAPNLFQFSSTIVRRCITKTTMFNTSGQLETKLIYSRTLIKANLFSLHQELLQIHINADRSIISTTSLKLERKTSSRMYVLFRPTN